MDMKQFTGTDNGRYNGRKKRGSITMEQNTSLTIIFYKYINDEDSERSRVYVTHISVYLSNIYTIQMEAF